MNSFSLIGVALKYRATQLAVFAGALTLTACAEPSSPESEFRRSFSLPSEARAQLDAAVGGRVARDVEDDILRMEAHVPGLGGVYLDDDEIIVFVPENSQRSEVLAGLARAAHTLSVEPDTRSRLAAGSGIRLRTGRYSFSQLIAWEQQLAPQLQAVAQVSFTDVNEARNQISLGLAEVDRAHIVVSVATRLGIPSDALSIESRPLERAATSLRDQVTTVAGGMQIQNPNGSLCTVGWNIHRGEDAPDGEEGFFTAGHCASSAQAGAGVANEMYQATTARRIGYLTQNPLWNVSDAGCTYSYCTRADAMYVRYDDPSESQGMVMAQPGDAGINNSGGSITANAIWTDLNGTASTFLVGSSVDKVGRTSGWTRGTLANTCANTNVATANAPYTVLCANKVENAAAGEGDSGGPVFQIGTNGIVRRGILFSTLLIGNLNDPTRNWDLNSEGMRVCNSSCLYSYSTWTQVNLWLPQPPF